MPRPISSLVLLLLASGLGSACNGAITEPGGRAPDPREVPAFRPSPAVLPRLTASQYRNTVRDLFGDPLPAVRLPRDTNPRLFYSIGASTTTLSETGVAQYEEAAVAITDTVFDDTTRALELIGCAPLAPDDPCAEGFLRDFGARAYRRPLSGDELAQWVLVSRERGGRDALLGLRFAVYGMLQSPSFIYRVQLGEVDPAEPERLRYTSWEMAERISYLLWNTTPDAELADAAARGELLDEDGIYAQATRLLESPRARSAVQAFFAQYFDLERLSRIQPDPNTFHGYDPALAEAMRTEIELLVDDFVFRRDADIRGLYDTRRTFVNAPLAALYGIDAPGATDVAFVPVELPEHGARAGVLTFGAFLAMNAHPIETSPTLRGKYVRERVLCESVPAPPDNADLDLSRSRGEPRTLRERLERHRNDAACRGCHAFIDPPGFLFERFDAIGQYRELDNGFPIDSTGNLDGVDLSDARDLADMLGHDERVPRCMVQQLYRHANARLDDRFEEAAIEELTSELASGGYRFTDLLVALVMHEGFRTLAPTPEVSP